jgi:hypothetical protein
MLNRLGRLVWLLVIAGTGCVAPVGAANVSIPRNAGNVCATQCASIGMGLSAVAIMADNIGCVCQGSPGVAAPAPATGGASASAGMATIAMLRARQQAAQQQQMRQQQMMH